MRVIKQTRHILLGKSEQEVVGGFQSTRGKYLTVDAHLGQEEVDAGAHDLVEQAGGC